MRKSMFVALLVALLWPAAGARAEKVDMDKLAALAQRYPLAMEVGTPGSPDYRFLYTNQQARIHAYKVVGGELKHDWEATDLGSKAVAMYVGDLYGDGGRKMVVASARGRVLIYDFNGYNLEWENLQYRYTTVEHLVCANIDKDPQLECILIADGLLYIFDMKGKNIQWVSDVENHARQIVIGNVDDDPQMEIILNTGRVIDSRFYNIEYEADGIFGERIMLLDVNGDGVDDVFGEFPDYSIRIVDVWAQREVW